MMAKSWYRIYTGRAREGISNACYEEHEKVALQNIAYLFFACWSVGIITCSLLSNISYVLFRVAFGMKFCESIRYVIIQWLLRIRKYCDISRVTVCLWLHKNAMEVYILPHSADFETMPLYLSPCLFWWRVNSGYPDHANCMIITCVHATWRCKMYYNNKSINGK